MHAVECVAKSIDDRMIASTSYNGTVMQNLQSYCEPFPSISRLFWIFLRVYFGARNRTLLCEGACWTLLFRLSQPPDNLVSNAHVFESTHTHKSTHIHVCEYMYVNMRSCVCEDNPMYMCVCVCERARMQDECVRFVGDWSQEVLFEDDPCSRRYHRCKPVCSGVCVCVCVCVCGVHVMRALLPGNAEYYVCLSLCACACVQFVCVCVCHTNLSHNPLLYVISLFKCSKYPSGPWRSIGRGVRVCVSVCVCVCVYVVWRS
jgi:hypothetical protein